MAEIQEIPLDRIHPNPINIRDEITEDDPATQRLADEISTLGVVNPALIYPHPEKPGEYIIRDGHRRRLASILAGKETLPAIIMDPPKRGAREDIEAMMTTGRNHRPLHRLEEARGMQLMLDLGMNESTIGKKFKQPKSHVVAKAKLAAADDHLSRAYGTGQLDLEQALELQKLEEAGEHDVYEEATKAIAARPWERDVTRVIAHSRQHVEQQAEVEALQELGGTQAPNDASYSGKYEQVTEWLGTVQHIEAGHHFRVTHMGDSLEIEWWKPLTKPATGLTEEEKADKKQVRELNEGLALAYATRRHFLVEAVQNPRGATQEADFEMLVDLLWSDISRMDEHLLGEITGISFPTEKVNDATWPQRTEWFEKVRNRLRSGVFTWRQIARMRALAQYYVAADKKMRRVDGYDMSTWDWHTKGEWIERLTRWFGYQLTDVEKAAIQRWQDRNPEEIAKDPRRKIEVN
ncbi:ParB/RepB/Spo0J family partition protein [Nesterenkonia rhizosphaerae]|uniref:ParB-like N-terminal domain-containing protein n=1 Tax=Nesterenkonia rhizosphaerae TaxID=1348272 RepID=A0ABP9FZ66_9MICC